MNLSNHFLIAMPSMHDPIFGGSVVYLCEHNERGALGVVINKPMDITIDHLLERLNMKLEIHAPVSYTHLDVYKRQAQPLSFGPVSGLQVFGISPKPAVLPSHAQGTVARMDDLFPHSEHLLTVAGAAHVGRNLRLRVSRLTAHQTDMRRCV